MKTTTTATTMGNKSSNKQPKEIQLKRNPRKFLVIPNSESIMRIHIVKRQIVQLTKVAQNMWPINSCSNSNSNSSCQPNSSPHPGAGGWRKLKYVNCRTFIFWFSQHEISIICFVRTLTNSDSGSDVGSAGSGEKVNATQSCQLKLI